MISRTTLLAAMALVFTPAVGLAQTAPSRIVPQARPDQAPRPPPERQAPTRPPVAAPSAPTTPAFVLRAVRVEGSTLPPETLAAAYGPLIGRTMDSAGLKALTDAIAAAYEAAGYALYTVVVPDQDFAGGTANLIAVEGYIESAQIDGGAGGRDNRLVEAYVAKLKAERPLKRRTLQRYVSLIRDVPGLNADINLAAGGEVGAVRLDIKTRPKTAQVGLGINNRGTAYLGRTQLQADLFLNSLVRQGDRTQLTYATPTRTELFQYYAIGHSQPVGSDGATVQVNAGYMRTRPEDTGLRGRATSLGVQVSRPLIRSFDRDLYLTVGVDGLNADNAFFGFTFSDDRTRAARISLAYSKTGEKSLLALSGSFSHGIDGLGARATSRGLSTLKFAKVNGRASYNRSLGETFVLRLSGAGQYTTDRLPGSEQFALGGDEFGRGFESAIIAGDYGYGASAELAVRPAKLFGGRLSGSELYGFADGGELWYRGRFGFPTTRADLRSAGAGVRLVVARRMVIQLEAARGLNNPTPFLDRKNWRGVFNVRTLF